MTAAPPLGRLAEECRSPAVVAPPRSVAGLQLAPTALDRVYRVSKVVTAPLVGRAGDRAALEAVLSSCRRGTGGLFLVSGEAGVGKTRLVDEVLGGWEGCVLRGEVAVGDPAYGPIVHVLREVADRFGEQALVDHARALLPELALPWRAVDHAALVAAVHGTLREIASRQPTVVVIEDLHWANAATIDLFPLLAPMLVDDALLVVGTYRADELPRSHPVRRMRAQLRRARQLNEVALRPLTFEGTTQLVAALVDAEPGPELVAALHERSAGLPFFIEELVAALTEGDALVRTGRRVSMAPGAEMPLPDSVTDAVLLRTATLLRRHGTAVELAAVMGVRVDLPILAALIPPGEVDALLDAGLLAEQVGNAATFRHALVRDALYRAVPWARRRSHHRAVAEQLVTAGARPEVVADHWIAAQEAEQARPLLLAAAERCCEVHAYRDAAALARRALAVWPPSVQANGRFDALERLAECAQLCGEVAEAAAVWGEVAEGRRSAGDLEGAAVAFRRLANALDMVGDWQHAVTARQAAAEAFAAVGERAEAAVERLALAERLESASQSTRALEHAVAALGDAEAAANLGLRAHAMALVGSIRTGLGETTDGLSTARQGVELALAEGLADAAGAAYYELATALIYAADYAGSAEAWESAVGVCRAHDLADLEYACLACMSVAVRFLGDWDRALALAGEVLHDGQTSDVARMVAEEESGLIAMLRGDRRPPTRRLRDAAVFGRDRGIFGIEVGATWGLAVAAASSGAKAEAIQIVHGMLDRCQGKELSHFALPAVRWAATFLADEGDHDGIARCQRIVATATPRNSAPKVLSTLAHAGGELAGTENDFGQAAEQFGRSIELLRGITVPYEHALTKLRWGAALARCDDRTGAVSALTSAYRTARQLAAKPLARRCAEELARLGEPVDRRLGRLAARALDPTGLTRREQQVLRLVATGRTNREIAKELFVSTRTVDMHVGNLLRKLECPTRAAAARRAVELGVVGSDEQVSPAS